jgi:hypothetical protein
MSVVALMMTIDTNIFFPPTHSTLKKEPRHEQT